MNARYDGHADWYDAWAQTAGVGFMAPARAALHDLMPDGSGAALDVGCGTGLHADVARSRGFTVLGVDYSADQLRLARGRLPVVRADGRALPFPDRSFQLVYSMLTHTDLEGFDRLVGEALRVLVPGGLFVHVGVHPCFVGPFVEREPDAVRLHAGYRAHGWQRPTAFTGTAVRHRVGVHHVPLESLLTAMVHPMARLDAVLERSGRATTGGARRPAVVRAPCLTGRLRQEDLEEDVAEDVETGLAAPSQGQMRPPWPHHTKETPHDEVPAPQALPRRPPGRQRRPDGPVDPGGGRGPPAVHGRLRHPARGHR